MDFCDIHKFEDFIGQQNKILILYQQGLTLFTISMTLTIFPHLLPKIP